MSGRCWLVEGGGLTSGESLTSLCLALADTRRDKRCQIARAAALEHVGENRVTRHRWTAIAMRAGRALFSRPEELVSGLVHSLTSATLQATFFFSFFFFSRTTSEPRVVNSRCVALMRRPLPGNEQSKRDVRALSGLPAIAALALPSRARSFARHR